MQQIVNFYLQSSLHVSLSVAAFTLLTFLQLELPVDPFVLGYTFCASVVAYNFIKYAPVWIKDDLYQPTLIKVITVVFLISLMVSMFFVPFKVIQLSNSLAFLIYAYTFPISKHIKKLRQIPLLKLFTIGFIWSIVSTLFPLFSVDTSIPLSDIIFIVIERIVWVIALLLPFEVRDIAEDTKSGKSLIKLIGIARAKLIITGLLVLFISLSYLVNEQLRAIDLFIYVSLIISVLLTQMKQHPYYSSLLVESLPVLWVLFWTVVTYV